jgi:hypothetical protein
MKLCAKGHAMTGRNVMRNGDTTCCRACRNERKRRTRDKGRALSHAPSVVRVPFFVVRDPVAAAIFGVR